jgi:hypothetical protein
MKQRIYRVSFEGNFCLFTDANPLAYREITQCHRFREEYGVFVLCGQIYLNPAHVAMVKEMGEKEVEV